MRAFQAVILEHRYCLARMPVGEIRPQVLEFLLLVLRLRIRLLELLKRHGFDDEAMLGVRAIWHDVRPEIDRKRIRKRLDENVLIE